MYASILPSVVLNLVPHFGVVEDWLLPHFFNEKKQMNESPVSARVHRLVSLVDAMLSLQMNDILFACVPPNDVTATGT